LSSPLLDNQRAHLVVNSNTGDCPSIELAVPDTAATWGRVINPTLAESPRARLILQGHFLPGAVSVSEIINPEPAPAPVASSTALIPPAERPPSENPVAYRSGWLWQPAWWMNTPEQLFSLADRENLERVYLTVPVDNGEVTNPQALARFITNAHERGIAVWAVVGDRRDVMPESLPALTGRANAYRYYNRYFPGNASLDGLQLDIEPYLLPGFTLDQPHWRERYITTVAAVHELLAGELPLDLVMPVWWGDHPDWSNQLLEKLTWPDLSVTIMNYRTDTDRLHTGGLPFLDWGEAHGTRVHMALEYGALADEQRKHFFPAANQGQLWLFDLGEHQVLVLLDDNYAGLPGRAWQLGFESEFSASTLTFNGNREALDTAAEVLSRQWSAWSSFAGIAIHGIDSLEQDQVNATRQPE